MYCLIDDQAGSEAGGGEAPQPRGGAPAWQAMCVCVGYVCVAGHHRYPPARVMVMLMSCRLMRRVGCGWSGGSARQS